MNKKNLNELNSLEYQHFIELVGQFICHLRPHVKEFIGGEDPDFYGISTGSHTPLSIATMESHCDCGNIEITYPDIPGKYLESFAGFHPRFEEIKACEEKIAQEILSMEEIGARKKSIGREMSQLDGAKNTTKKSIFDLRVKLDRLKG